MFWIRASTLTSLKKDLLSQLFFILSGFIIAYNYEEKLLETTTTKRTFWVARIARIYPLHLLTLLIAACIGGYVQYNDTTDWIKHFAASTFLLQPFFPSADYFFSLNSPSWSLGCEQLFYFCFPHHSFLK